MYILGICLKLCPIILGATYRHTPSMRCRCALETLAILMTFSQLSIKWASYRMYVKACTHYRWSCFESRGSKNCTITRPPLHVYPSEWKREEHNIHSSTIDWLYHQNLILSIVEERKLKIFLLHGRECFVDENKRHCVWCTPGKDQHTAAHYQC